MRIEITNGKNKQQMKLNAESIVKYLIGNDDKMDTLIMCKSSELNLVTTNHALYEALGSIRPYDDFKLNKLVKFLEVVKILSLENNPILTEERVEEIRKNALEKTNQIEKK